MAGGDRARDLRERLAREDAALSTGALDRGAEGRGELRLARLDRPRERLEGARGEGLGDEEGIGEPAHRVGFEAGGRPPADEREVEASAEDAVDEILLGERDEGEGDAGGARERGRDPGQDPPLEQAVSRAEGEWHRPRLGGAGHVLEPGAEGARDRRELAAEIGELDGAARAADEILAEELLELGDLPAELALSDRLAGRRSRDAPRVRDGDEGAESIDGEAASTEDVHTHD